MLLSQKFRINNIDFAIKVVLRVDVIETWTKLHRRDMQWIYVYFNVHVLKNNAVFQRILLHTVKQNFSILRHLVGKISHLEFNVYRTILTEASYWKLFAGVVCEMDILVFIRNVDVEKEQVWLGGLVRIYFSVSTILNSTGCCMLPR